MITMLTASFVMLKIRCENGGRTQLMQHGVQKKHVESTKHSLDKKTD